MKPIDADLRGCFLADRPGGADAWPERRIDPVLPSRVFASARTASPLAALQPTDSRREAGRSSSERTTRQENAARAAEARLRGRRAGPSAGGTTTKLLRRGALIDKYRISDVLGMGGFAVVYRATHLLLETPVAIKLLRAEVLAARPGIEAQLIVEARFAARINHPNVVRIYDVTHSAELTYIVMEYIEGTALSKQLALRGCLAPSRVVQIGLDVVAGLRAGLEQGLIHRDIKPANILLSRGGMATIVDYGMAHAAEPGNWLEEDAPAVVGTRGYMAPEQAVDSTRVDFRADIFALGVTLEEAALGQLRTRTPRGPEPGQAVPPRLARLLRSMQKPSPSDRPASYNALFDELSAIQGELASEQPAKDSSAERGRPSG